jgi:hypothetical protein
VILSAEEKEEKGLMIIYHTLNFKKLCEVPVEVNDEHTKVYLTTVGEKTLMLIDLKHKLIF